MARKISEKDLNTVEGGHLHDVASSSSSSLESSDPNCEIVYVHGTDPNCEIVYVHGADPNCEIVYVHGAK